MPTFATDLNTSKSLLSALTPANTTKPNAACSLSQEELKAIPATTPLYAVLIEVPATGKQVYRIYTATPANGINPASETVVCDIWRAFTTKAMQTEISSTGFCNVEVVSGLIAPSTTPLFWFKHKV